MKLDPFQAPVIQQPLRQSRMDIVVEFKELSNHNEETKRSGSKRRQ
ncbi:TPA: hypothetical protein ACRYYE_001212 [Klebsiella pneumoniae]